MSHACHGCGRLHDDRGEALRCCSDRFGLDELVTDEWQTVIEREERSHDRVVSGGEAGGQ